MTPYVDGQLPDPDRQAVDQHLRVCAPCHSRVAAERAVRDLLQARKASLSNACAPKALHAKCALYARLQSHDMGDALTRGVRPKGRVWAAQSTWRARLAPFAVAASLVLIVGAAFLYQLTESSSRVLAAELTADHVKCFAMNSVLHTHDTPAAVESAMVSGFGWRMQLPAEPARAGLELVGARPCLYGEGKIAHIMYRHHGEPVSLFMLPKSVRAQEVVEVLGHEAAIWCEGDRTFVLLARKPREEVDNLAAFVQASLK